LDFFVPVVRLFTGEIEMDGGFHSYSVWPDQNEKKINAKQKEPRERIPTIS